MIKARRLKDSETPGKTELYEVGDSRDIVVEERQKDGSVDHVVLEFRVAKGDVGYFAKEYRPADVQKTGSKVIDITAVMLNDTKQCVRWHLYDIKDTLAGENTVVKLYDQWNFGLKYLRNNVLFQMPQYLTVSDLGVITRNYDEERMKRLKNDYQRRCAEIESYQQKMTLIQRKKRTNIAKYRGILKASQAILDRNFQAEGETDTYEIHIRQLSLENEREYKVKFPV